jgi:hypothetical protein
VNNLKLTKLKFAAEAVAGAFLPPYLGNSLRGAFGRSLCRRSCKRDKTDCEYCANAPRCAYARVFKSQTKTDGMDSVPNPFVIGVDWSGKERYEIGDDLRFTITLFGNADTWRDEVVSAVDEMFTGKLDCLKLRENRIEYAREWSDDGNLPAVDTLVVRLKTPLVMLTGKSLVTEIDFAAFADSVFGRIAGINDTYGEKEFILPYALTHRKPKVIVESRLRAVTIRQEKQPITGLMGEVRFRGGLTRYMPYIDLCSQLHIGKMTTRGCGRYAFAIGENAEF